MAIDINGKWVNIGRLLVGVILNLVKTSRDAATNLAACVSIPVPSLHPFFFLIVKSQQRSSNPHLLYETV